jgi:hypothetical protein
VRARDYHRRHLPTRFRPLPGFWSLNYRCGLHSGFPKCCIRFFVKTWIMGSHADIRVHAVKMLSSAASMGKWWGYIPCPDCCLKHEPVEVLRCPPGSHSYTCGANVERYRPHQRRGFVAKRHRSL